MKYSFLLLLIFSAPFLVLAQQTSKPTKKQAQAARKKYLDAIAKKEEEGAIVFDKSDVFGIKLNTDGYGLFFEHSKFKTMNKNRLWWFELGERKDPKEKRITLDDGTGGARGNSFIFLHP